MSDNTAIDIDLDAPSTPSTLILYLEPSTKAQYDTHRRSPDVVARKPFGFLHMRGENRTVYIADHGKYYVGTYPAFYTVADFQNSEKRDARVYTQIDLRVAA